VNARRLLALTVVALVGGCGGGGSSSTTRTTRAAPTSSQLGPGTSDTSSAPANTSTTGGPPATVPAPATTAGPPVTTTPAATAATDRCATPSQAPPRSTFSADFPTALAFAPDGRLFYAERSGTVRVVQGGQPQAFASVATVTTESGGGYSERGLLGLAISPRFAQDRFVYAFYSDADRSHQDVIRWTDCAGRGTAATVIIRLPAGPDCCHKGGRLAFGPDGKLYVTLGEEHQAPVAQDTSDVRGKVLRYNPDGSVPNDNPFGTGDPVWAYGFRNPYGLAFSPAGQLAVTSNGPSGEVAGGPSTGYDTAVVSVARGGGYQWPNCFGYSHPLAATSCGLGQHAPDWSSEASTVVPTGATFVDGSGPAGFAGHLVFCTFAAGMKVLTPAAPHATVANGPPTCQLDVKQGPDHALYFSDTGHIYRMG
jgi:glucose/arabinose dehydrogenase